MPQQLDDLLPTGFRNEGGGPRVFLGVLAIRLEAVDRPPGGGQGGGIVPAAKIAHDLVKRVPQAVHVQAVEADFLLFWSPLVEPLHPTDQFLDFAIGPHPRRPAAKCGQRLFGGVRGARVALHETIDPIAIGPIALDRDEIEALLLDETAREGRSPHVKLMRSM